MLSLLEWCYADKWCKQNPVSIQDKDEESSYLVKLFVAESLPKILIMPSLDCLQAAKTVLLQFLFKDTSLLHLIDGQII